MPVRKRPITQTGTIDEILTQISQSCNRGGVRPAAGSFERGAGTIWRLVQTLLSRFLAPSPVGSLYGRTRVGNMTKATTAVTAIIMEAMSNPWAMP